MEILLLHSGGPFYAHQDDGAWTIPKGELEPGEEPLGAAWREFEEETGWAAWREARAIALAPVKVTAAKTLHAWLVEGEAEPERLRSATFAWRGRLYPEADRAGWFSLEQAEAKMFLGQRPLLRAIREALSRTSTVLGS